MDFKEMESEQLIERRNAIAEELDAPEADLDALEAEVRAINEELEARKNNEAKKAEVRKAIANGEQPVEQIKEFKASIGGSVMVIFQNGYKDYISRRELKNVKERIGL